MIPREIRSRRSMLGFVVISLYGESALADRKKKHGGKGKGKGKGKKKKPTSRVVQRSGNGPQITGKFQLEAGRYRATATESDYDQYGSNFIVWLWGPEDYEELVFNELPDGPGTYHYESVVEAGETGLHFFEVEHAPGPWTISLRPI